MYLFSAVIIFVFNLAHVKSGLEQRIVGGSTAKISKFSFYVSIRSHPGDYYLCGGAIIGRDWVVTAAHCVFNKHRNNILVVAGTDDLNGAGDRYSVSDIQIPRVFNINSRNNNTALLKLTRSVTLGKDVSAIALAKDVIPNGKTLELCGFGAVAYPFRSMSSVLMYIETNSISNDQCRTDLMRYISSDNLCAKGKSDKGACVGDGGSPLIKRGGLLGITKLYGILSWDSSCAQGRPDVYSSIAAARPWIKQIAGI